MDGGQSLKTSDTGAQGLEKAPEAWIELDKLAATLDDVECQIEKLTHILESVMTPEEPINSDEADEVETSTKLGGEIRKKTKAARRIATSLRVIIRRTEV